MAKYVLILLLALPILSLAQERDVSGVVKDAMGSPMPGVSIVVKGTTNGTTTDVDGAYRISMNTGTLVFSFIGYTTKEVVIETQTTADVVLEESANQLDEVVVVGYGAQKKKDVSTAIVIVDEKALKDRPMVSLAEGLQGKAAGVQVTQPSGKPGGDISVRVRGATSVLLRNDPLYVVDGVPMTDIRGINSQDIVSMSVLKDAASSAIYGLRGANGVVLITTKSGRSGQQTLQFGAYGGFSKLRKEIKTLNTAEYRDLMSEMNQQLDPSWTDYTDWNSEVFGTGYVQNYQLTFSGGTDKSHFLTSANYLKNDGIVAPASFDRYSVRLNFDSQLKPWLKVGSNVNVLNSKTLDTPDNASSGRGGVIMSTFNTPPFMHVYKSDGSGQFDPNPYQNSWENPKAYMFGADQESVDNRLIGNLMAEAKIVEGLTFKSSFAVDFNTHRWDYYLDPFRTTDGRNNHGVVRADKSTANTWTFENFASYNRAFGKNNVTVMAGTGLIKSSYYDSYAQGTDLIEDTSVKTLSGANVVTAETYVDEWALASFFGRALYDYDGKYLFTASIRRDGSSKLASKWQTFPSFSAAWRISSESFMNSFDFLNELKIRAAWGKTGNQDGLPNNYLAFGQYRYTRFERDPLEPPRGPNSYFYSIGNPYLRWEVTTQTNIGLDVSVLNARLSFTMDAYFKKTNDLILDIDLPATVGDVHNILTNGGAIENKGLEFSVSSVNVEGNNFSWNSDLNISFNRNKVAHLTYTPVSYFGPIYSNNTSVSMFREGYPMGVFYGYVSDGVDPDTGDIIYRDLNKNGYKDPGDRKVIGNPNPDFTFGFTNTLSYKRFELNVFFQGSYGNDIFNSTRIDLEGMFDSKNQSTAVLKRWTTENRNTNIPRAGGGTKNVDNSTRFIEDGTYVRLKAITLKYNFDTERMSKIGINRLSVYATGQNLLTFTKYSGLDPEVNAFGNSPVAMGIDYGTYPQAITVILGLNVEF